MIPRPLRRRLASAGLGVGLLAGAATTAVAPAHAQLTVFDPSNYSQNVLTAARTLQQINNQIQSLQNEAQSLLNQAQSLANQGRNLTNLATSPLSQLQQDIQRTRALFAQAQGLATQVSSLDQQFRLQYPSGYGAGTTAGRTLADARTQWSNSLEGLRTTLSMQAQVNDAITADQGTLASVVGSSQGAVGILQATQATNQLLALIAKQTMQDQQLRLAEGRSTALEQARMLQAEEQGRANRQRFQGNGVAYTPAPVQAFRQ
jgi:P-type conjugative transfer protein TrbJ